MKISKNRFTLLILLVSIFNCAYQQVFAQADSNLQEQETKYVFYLKDGTIIKGDLLEWQPEVIIKLKMTTGQVVTLDADKVKKFVEFSAVNHKSKAPYNFKEKGFYGLVKANIIGGNGGNRANGSLGAGASVVYGYQYNRWLGVGLGVGYDKYILDTGEDLIPVFIDLIGYTSAKNFSPFYHLALGYSFSQDDPDFGIVDAKGGLLIHPSIGLRVGSKSIKWLFDIGYRFQFAEFTYGNQFDPINRRFQDLTYKRLHAGISLYF